MPTIAHLQQHQLAPHARADAVTEFIRTSTLRQKLEFDANLLIAEISKAFQKGDATSQIYLPHLIQVITAVVLACYFDTRLASRRHFLPCRRSATKHFRSTWQNRSHHTRVPAADDCITQG